MARISKANTIIAVDNAATALTTMFQDDVLTETAEEYKNPMTPLRMLAKLFVFDVSTGVWNTNADYVNAAYDGAWPYKGDGKNDVGAPIPLSLITATIEVAAPADIVLTFSNNIQNTSILQVGGAGSAGKKIKKIASVGAVLTITMDTDYIAADVVTVTGDFFAAAYTQSSLAAQAVINNLV